jgi:glutathione S-transferase
MWERREELEESAFVGGDSYSTADITAVVAVDFATKALTQGLPESNQATRRWYDLIAARPSTSACATAPRLVVTVPG